MARTATVRTNTGPVVKSQRKVSKAGKVAKALKARLSSPRGATSGGGGRGGFAGGLGDFFSRDEFIGRTGTIGRAGAAGNLVGFGLALMSIEELATKSLALLQGKTTWKEAVKSSMELLLPSVLTKVVPEIINEYHRREVLALSAMQQRKDNARNVELQLKIDEGFRKNFQQFRQIRFTNSNEYRRMLSGAQGRRGF